MAWDDTTADLRVTSLHSFEGSDANLSEGRQLLQPPLLAADPLGRCAAAVVYGTHLAALQRYQLDEDEAGAQVGCGRVLRGPLPGVMGCFDVSKTRGARLQDE